jgi:hypothetical protein
MPNFNGMGPTGKGSKTGRGLGICGEARLVRPGFCRGMGPGYGRGCGYGMGWASVGYAQGGPETVSASMRTSLEERKEYLRSELARTEALLSRDSVSANT